MTLDRRAFLSAPLAATLKDAPPEKRDALADAINRLADAVIWAAASEHGRFLIEMGKSGNPLFPVSRDVVYYPHMLEERISVAVREWRIDRSVISVVDLVMGERRTADQILEAHGWV